MHEGNQVRPVVDDDVGVGLEERPEAGAVLGDRLSLLRPAGDPFLTDGGDRIIVGRERVARGEADVRPGRPSVRGRARRSSPQHAGRRETVRPRRGRSVSKRRRTPSRTGMCERAHSSLRRPRARSPVIRNRPVVDRAEIKAEGGKGLASDRADCDSLLGHRVAERTDEVLGRIFLAAAGTRLEARPSGRRGTAADVVGADGAAVAAGVSA